MTIIFKYLTANFLIYRIQKMHKVGLINKWLVDTLPKKDQCWTNAQLEVTNHKVNLDDMQGSFIVLLLG